MRLGAFAQTVAAPVLGAKRPTAGVWCADGCGGHDLSAAAPPCFWYYDKEMLAPRNIRLASACVLYML
jgi:hypothetical protein